LCWSDSLFTRTSVNLVSAGITSCEVSDFRDSAVTTIAPGG
jgi:hypothetical protein